MICAEQNKKISFLTTYNPFSNRAIFSFIPVLACWYMAIHYHAMYQTCDDMDMRILLEGSIGGSISEPSEFTLYMNVLYGKILKFFYTVYRNGYWYDIFTYLFASVSLFVLAMSVCKDFERESLFSKILKLVIITFVGATPFISPQFTMTSGLLAMSGVLSFYMWVSEYFTGKKAQFACAVYCVIALLFSSLIRFECCMIVGFFTGVLLIPWWPYKEWRKHLKKCSVVGCALLTIIGAYLWDGYIVSHHPEWDEMRKANNARVEIADKTNIWDNINAPWKNVVGALNDIDNEEIFFSSGDYRMLLTSYFIGDKKIYNSNNLNKAVNAISDKVQASNSLYAGFRIKDFRDVFKYFIFIYVLIFCLSNRTFKYNIYAGVVFFILVIALNVEFRALPYRLWYNFAFITIIVLLIKFKCCNFIKLKNKIYTVVGILCLVMGIFFSYTIMHNQAISTRYQYKIYKQMQNEVQHLPQNEFYITDFVLVEHACHPFGKNILKNIISMTPVSNHPSSLKILKNNNININSIWNDLSNRKKNIRIITHSGLYFDAHYALKSAISYYIKEKYGKEVVFLYKTIGGFYITQCIALTEAESKIKKVYEQKIKPLAVSDDIKLIMKYELIRDTLGYWASYQDIAEVFTILNGEFIKSE